MTRLEAFRLIGGPCDGHIAELPVEGFEETWRCVGEEPVRYARYERDGAVFRFAGEIISGEDLAARLHECGAEVTLGRDSREYER
jgi:hypothetical protein